MNKRTSPLGQILMDTARNITMAHMAGRPLGTAQVEGAARIAEHYRPMAEGARMRNIKVQGRITCDFNVVRVTHDFVFLTDEADKTGGRSVTNAAEAVVAECLREYGKRRIIYRDTGGQWDELVHDGERFTTYAPAAEIARKEFGS